MSKEVCGARAMKLPAGLSRHIVHLGSGDVSFLNG